MPRPMKRFPLALTLLLVLASFSGCIGGGYDAQRYSNDADNHALATRLRDGWFGGLTWTEADKASVDAALAAWSRRLDADAAVLGVKR